MSTKLETETRAAKIIQSYKDTASQIGRELEPGNGIDNGDFPRHAYTNLMMTNSYQAMNEVIPSEYTKQILTVI